MEKNNKSSGLPSLLKKAAISAAAGHACAVFFLFLASTALVKNPVPSSLVSVAAPVALFLGAAVCGVLAGKIIDLPLGGALAGILFSVMLVAVSLAAGALARSGDTDAGSGYGIGFKIGMLAGAAMLSAVVGLFLSGRKSSKKSLARHRKRAMGK